MNIFNKREANIFPTFIKIIYIINLKNNKELFFNSLYNLLTNKFKIIKMYINISLIKG